MREYSIRFKGTNSTDWLSVIARDAGEAIDKGMEHVRSQLPPDVWIVSTRDGFGQQFSVRVDTRLAMAA